MFIIETHSKPLRKWSKLMFVLFLITHVGMFGGLLTMHMYVKPSQKKSALEEAAKHNIGDQVESGGRDGAVMARTIAIWIFGLLASAIIGGLVGSRLEPMYSYDWGVWGALAGMLAFACLRLWLAAPSKKGPTPPTPGR
jgi:heme/copper-type cytochrome/quinol oxidase subunit 3